MQTTETILSPAKLNFGLQVLEPLSNGYHRINSVFIPLMFSDQIELHLETAADLSITIAMHPDWDIAVEHNLIFRAAQAFARATGLTFHLHARVEKRIPPGSGLGGGSSNAAMVLRWLNQQLGFPLSETELLTLARQLGSDVPFFLQVQPETLAVVGGTGEELQWYSWDVPYEFLLVIPPVHVSTHAAYEALARRRSYAQQPRDFFHLLRGYWDCGSKLRSQIVNDFETVVFEQFPILRSIKEQLLEHSLMLYAGLSGTGATVFGCTLDPECAEAVAQRFGQPYRVIRTRQLAEQRAYV